MNKIPSFDSLRAKTIGRAPVFFKEAQEALPPGMSLGQGMGGVTTGRPDEMQAPESADETQFENDFSTLAYQFVQDRAPALLPYMLGFEVVDRSEDGSKAVGIYGYKIDDDFYYIPVFFINNQIRGVDMILNKRTNNFMPLTEDWINYIVNKHSVTLGQTVGDDINQTLEQPDLTFLRAPKSQAKSAEAEDGMWSLKTAWHMMKEQSQKMAEFDPLLKEMFNGVLRSVKGVPFKKYAEAKYINGFMRTVGGPEAQISLLKSFKNVKFANAALKFYENLDAFNETNVKDSFLHKQAMAKKAAALPKVRIVTAADAPKVEDNTSVNEDEAKQILSRGFSIRDARPAETTADMTDDTITVDFEKRFSTPTEVGKYSFVMEDGKLREGFLLSLTHASEACSKDTTAVYFPDDKVVATAPASAIIVDSGSESKAKGDSYSELFDSALDKENVEPSVQYGKGKGYMFIGPNGQAFTPCRIQAVFKDGDDVAFSVGSDTYKYTVRTRGALNTPDFGNWDIHDRFHDANGYRKDHAYIEGYDSECCSPSCGMSRIRFSSGITKPSISSKGVVLPDNWKVVEVTNVEPYTDIDYNKTTEAERNKIRENDEKEKQSYIERYTFGSTSSILASMQAQGVARVKIASVGPDTFHLSVDGYNQTPGMTYKEAAITLVTHFGVRPKEVFENLEKAASSGSVRVLITGRKQAIKEAQGVGVSMPMPIDQNAAMDPYTGIPVYSDPYVDIQNGQFSGVPSLPPEGGLTKNIALGSEIQRNATGPQDEMLPIDQQAQQLADEAARAGQKHVFDQAAVGGLSKVYDTSAVVDSYIPNFMDTLDRLGRVLFLFYWKHDEFNSRYGSDDVVEMEDRLRGVFKQLGDLTLKLKEKAVRTD